MEELKEHHFTHNETNGTFYFERNLSTPLERTSLTEAEMPINRPSPPVDLESLKLQNTLLFMQTYASPLIFCTGIPLNLISLAIIAGGCLRKTSMIQYLYAILTTDVTLLANLLMMWLTQRGFDLYRLGALCHFTSFLSHTSSFLSLWITVCLAVDGYIRICFTHSSKTLCTNIRARVVILCLVACATAVYLNISLMVGVVPTPSVHICAPVNRYVTTLKLLGIADVFINLMLPYIGLLYLFLHITVTLLLQLCKAPQSHRKIHLQTDQETALEPINMQLAADEKRISEKEEEFKGQTDDCLNLANKQLASICLCVVVFTLCLNLPSAVMRTYHTLLQMMFPLRPMVVTQFLWQQLLQYPYYMKSACNFFILLLASKDFRQTVCNIPRKCCGILVHSLRSNSKNVTSNGRERVSIEADPEDPDN